jgi:hypothetical protein
MKGILIIAALLTTGLSFLTGCKQRKEIRAVVIDEWWSSDYAVSAGWSKCQMAGGAPKYCDSEEVTEGSRQEEAQFTNEFSTAFQTDTACSGVTLAVFKNSNDDSPGREIMNGGDSYWSFLVNFVPGEKKQSWAMNLRKTGKFTNLSSGEGNVRSMVHSVCLIVNGAGGSVAE